MSTADTTKEMHENADSVKDAGSIDLSTPFAEVCDKEDYKRFAARTAEIYWEDEGKTKHIDEVGQIIITNYAYFIHEFLYLNTRRSLDYAAVKNFAHEYKEYFAYIFDGTKTRVQLGWWLKEDVDMSSMSMYAGTNRYNKNTYH